MDASRLSVKKTRLWSRLMDMATIGEIPLQGSRRLALSSDDQRGRDLFLSWAEDRGFSHVHDQIGNLFVRREGRDKAAKPLVMGSHLDTQPNGGRFDGVVGVLAGFEVLETLEDHSIETAQPIEVAVWTNEEGARFHPAMMGSGVHCGIQSLVEALTAKDMAGISVRDEVMRNGYLDGPLPGSHAIDKYIELHIEQGPVLEDHNKTIGIVTGGQGIRWYELTILGDETHAGPVPMDRRRDPVPTLARIIDLVQAVGRTNEQARSTIGRIEAAPGSMNVVPGRISISVDLRHPDDDVLLAMHGWLQSGIVTLNENQKGVQTTFREIWHSPAVHFDAALIALARERAGVRGYPTLDIVSGAGHDAFNLARIVPTTMVFVPCRDGVSHNEREYAEPEHVSAGSNVLLDMVLALALPAPRP